MQINTEHIAKLARLRIEEHEKEKFARQMQEIVDMVEALPPQEEGPVPIDAGNPMELRADIVEESLRRDKLLANAPKVHGGCLEVPKTIE